MGRSGDRFAGDGMRGWTLIVAVSDEDVLRSTLLKSPDVDARWQIVLKRGYSSAGRAYNAGIAEAKNEILVFAHQDVYLPPGWLNSLTDALADLSNVDPDWGVLGVFGIAKTGKSAGYVYSTGIGAIVGKPFAGVIEATSVDEMLFVTRGSAGLSFDERLPGFHLYGTDICLQTRSRGMKNFIIPAFCVHNSNGIRSLPASFWRSYFYMRRKWRYELPVATCCATITRELMPIAKQLALTGRNFLLGSGHVGARCENPDLLYRDLLRSGAARES